MVQLSQQSCAKEIVRTLNFGRAGGSDGIDLALRAFSVMLK
jgi:hypothetical protein